MRAESRAGAIFRRRRLRILRGKFYTGEADEDVENDCEQGSWAEEDDAWRDCEDSYYRRGVTARLFDPGEFDEVDAAGREAKKHVDDWT